MDSQTQSKTLRCSLVSNVSEVAQLPPFEGPTWVVVRARPRSLTGRGAQGGGGREAAADRYELPEGADSYPAAIMWLKTKLVPKLTQARQQGVRVELEILGEQDSTAKALRDSWSSYWGKDPSEPEPVLDATPPETPKIVDTDRARGRREAGENGSNRRARKEKEAVKPLEVLLRDVEKHARTSGENNAATREALQAVKAHPEVTDEVMAQAEERVRKGVQSSTELDDIRVFARRHGEEHPKVVELVKAYEENFPYLRDMLKRTVRGSATARQRAFDEARALALGDPLSTVKAGEPSHALATLAAAPSWALHLTEVNYRQLGEHVPARSRIGRVVALLVPEGSALPVLPSGAPDRELDDATRDQWLQSLLDTPSVGVLGVTVDAVSPLKGHRWATGLLESVSWVLRLMPLEGNTKLTVSIEPPDVQGAGTEWASLLNDLQRQLAELHPKRYKNVSLRGRTTSSDHDGFGGYLSALGQTWAAGSRKARARLRQSQLLGACLQRIEGENLRKSWDLLQRGGRISIDDWAEIIKQPDAHRAHSIAHQLLDQLGTLSKGDTQLWRRYADAARMHVYEVLAHGRGARLSQLGREIDWLETHRPENASLSKSLQLVHSTARVDTQEGTAPQRTEEEIQTLSKALFEEAAPLLCQVDLERAGAAIHRFAFHEAQTLLERWRETQPAVPGLRHYGRVHLMLGQLAAFQGDFAQADRGFEEARNAFARLSDHDQAQSETRHVLWLRAVTALERTDLDADTRRSHLEAIVKLSEKSIRDMAMSDAISRRHDHHLLLRYLVEFASAEEKQAYLNARGEWRTNDGHPWHLIEAYRGLLLQSEDAQGAADHMLHAWSMTLDPELDPIAHLVGASLGLIAKSMGADCPVSEPMLTLLREMLPAASTQIDKLSLALSESTDAIALLRSVLPLNFR